MAATSIGDVVCICVAQAVSLLEEVITPRKELPPLLLKLSERRAERLDYLGVSYGLTTQLLKYDSLTCKDWITQDIFTPSLTMIDAI